MTDKKTEALKLALEALEWINRVNAMEYEYQQKARESLNAIYEALAEQPAQQQVPERMKPFVQRHHITSAEFTAFHVGFCCGEEFNKQPAQQKPVAWRAWFDADNGARWLFSLWPEEERLDVEWQPLYTSPPAQPQQEPVAFDVVCHDCGGDGFDRQDSNYRCAVCDGLGYVEKLLYTSPPAQRKPLTDEQILRLVPGLQDCLCDPWDYNNSGDDYASIPKDMIRLARAIEAAHGIKE